MLTVYVVPFPRNEKAIKFGDGGLEVEQWSDNRTRSISVDQSPLGAS